MNRERLAWDCLIDQTKILILQEVVWASIEDGSCFALRLCLILCPIGDKPDTISCPLPFERCNRGVRTPHPSWTSEHG